MEKISNIRLNLDEEESDLLKKVAKIARLKPSEIAYLNITKKSIDARKKNDIHFVYSVEFDTTEYVEAKREYEQISTDKKIVVVGLGPAGLFCALNLARRGLKPLVIERGEAVEARQKTVSNFIAGGSLNTSSNIQFGEGGAGTFSDGKLNTQVNNQLIGEVLRDFVNFGAPKEIMYLSKPHIGSDNLPRVVSAMREEIKRLGGKVLFNSHLDDIIVKNGTVKSIKVSGEELPCDMLVLAIGHSARDTFEMLFNCGVDMAQKEFAVGLRIEQLQEVINASQYGKFAKHKKLGSADYKLTYHGSVRSAFTFCMCPGGVVMPATSEENAVVVNGMSNFARDKINANSALIAQIKTLDFENSHPLSGVKFQRELERKAFLLGGGDYKAPVQTCSDYISGTVTKRLENVIPSYQRGYEFADLNALFSKSVNETLKGALVHMDKTLNGFASMGAVLTGVESRTSSPIRIFRGEDLQSVNVKGIYPCGEGCGYAGGIMSASIDGIKVADAIIQNLSGRRYHCHH